MINLTSTCTVSLLIICCLLLSSKPLNAQCHIDDWTALKALYEATDGDNWYNNYGWELVKSDEPRLDCNLENLGGVKIDESGRVDSINIRISGLKGEIPSELERLTNIVALDLEANELNGNIPPELGNLKNLVELDLSQNNLSGSIPIELGNLNNLKNLDFSLNELSGSIPAELGNLGRLEQLELYSNQLNGDIPPSLGSLTNLKSIRLMKNQLSGSIPPELGNLKNLTGIDISENQFDGSIPPELGQLQNIVNLELHDNEITGSIPLELGNLNELQALQLYNNKISGSIPSSLGKLKNMDLLVLNNNQLSGSIPPELEMLDNLVYLSLFGNELSGSIPPELSNLNKLASMVLYDNNISGNIPSELSKLDNLSRLNLSNNNLSGHIPPEFGDFNRLSNLSLEKNQLSGNIPSELGSIRYLKSLNLSNNQLSGIIPPELGNLEKLYELALHKNELNGSIPIEIGNLNDLEYLILHENELNGNIPSELGELRNLDRLMLNDNKLSGTIPFEFGNILSLEYFNVANNQLSGILPEYLSAYNEDTFVDIRYNYFVCSDVLNFKYDKDSINLYNYTPQKYIHNNEQSFLINSSEESIILDAPFNQFGNFTYQWYNNETPVEGAIDTILSLTNIRFEDVGSYALHVTDPECITDGGDELTYISNPITVRRTDLEGCTDQNSCNYNEFAMIDDGSCEYIWCDTLTNPIKIRTTNEVILSDTQIKFDLVIDSLGLDYSADGLTFTLDTRGNYNLESIQVINPILSVVEVDISKLYNGIISINRINNQRLASNEPIINVTGCIAVDEIHTDESSCSHFVISGGTELASRHFIDFDNIYIDIPFSDCSPYGDFGAEGENWLPLVLTINPQNCNTEKAGLAEIKILEEGQNPFAYTLKNEQGEIALEATSNNKQIELPNLNAGNYELTVFDMDGRKTVMHTCIPLVNSLDGNETCQTNCVDYVTIPDGNISGTHFAKKEIEIKGFVGKDETVEFGICE